MEEKVLVLTQKQYDEKKQKLEYLKVTKAREIVDRIEEARGYGDLSENSEYDEARTAQADNNLMIERLEAELKNVKIIDESTLDVSTVSIGLLVTLENLTQKNTKDYYLVASTEADPFATPSRLSCESLMGKAIIGKKVGDVVTVNAPNGVKEYKIKKIALKD